MKKFIFFLIILQFVIQNLIGVNIKVWGRILDSSTDQPIAGVIIQIIPKIRRVCTNANGYYEMWIPRTTKLTLIQMNKNGYQGNHSFIHINSGQINIQCDNVLHKLPDNIVPAPNMLTDCFSCSFSIVSSNIITGRLFADHFSYNYAISSLNSEYDKRDTFIKLGHPSFPVKSVKITTTPVTETV